MNGNRLKLAFSRNIVDTEAPKWKKTILQLTNDKNLLLISQFYSNFQNAQNFVRLAQVNSLPPLIPPLVEFVEPLANEMSQ
jgi:hypothetical protein